MAEYPNLDVNLDWDFLKFFHSYDSSALRRGYKVFKNTPLFHKIDLRTSQKVLTNKVFTPAEMQQVILEQKLSGDPKKVDPIEEIVNKTLQAKLSKKQQVNLIYGFFSSGDLIPPPKGLQIGDGKYFNPFASGMQTHYAPLKDKMITFDDGIGSSVPQMAHDLATFLWFLKHPRSPDNRLHALSYMSLLIFPISALVLKRSYKANLLSRRIETYVTNYKK